VSYDELATALEYPARAWVREALSARGFAAWPGEELEELYTRTFDINPVCSLEVGWHLYGEDYNRGAFLVGMRGLMRDLGVAEGTELPDHLTSVLRVLGRMAPEEADGFARGYVLPAVGKMLSGFPDGENPYRDVVEEIERFLRDRHGDPHEWVGAPEQQPYGCGGCHGVC